MKTVVIASNNAHKIEEIRNTLDFPGWCFVSLKDSGFVSNPEENGSTFLENARIKARALHELTGGAVLADDSGLEVDALGGAPGVRSARYASLDGLDASDSVNNAKLLRELGDVPAEKRTARFVCSLVFIDEDGSEVTAEGAVAGRIGFYPRGEEGFGYDPLFLPDAFGGETSMAEVSQEQKGKISHRGEALCNLKQKMQNR